MTSAAHMSRPPAISVRGITKKYASGFEALRGIDLEIRRGEIFALLGPNGAGKTTLISIICGIVTPTQGTVHANGFDNRTQYRMARAQIGLVPQELSVDNFVTVSDTVAFSRGLFGKPPNPAYIERLLRDLSLWDKRHDRVLSLSGGMKRRVMIAKALSHEPPILFLDEPTAGVDVALRRDMWAMVRGLRAQGVTIILTTHYIEEAEDMADRIGVINHGRITLVEDKTTLMRQLGTTQLVFTLSTPQTTLPDSLKAHALTLSEDGTTLVCSLDAQSASSGLNPILRALDASGLTIRNIESRQSSLEDIFVDLVRDTPERRTP